MRALYLYGVTNDGEYGKTIRSHFTGKFCSSKKKYLIKKLISSKNLKTYFLINYNKKFFYDLFKLYLWVFLNNFNLFQIKFASRKSIKKNDIFYSSSRTVLKDNNIWIKKIDCIKIFHLTHLEVETSLISNNAYKIGVSHFIFENNLYISSPYFRKFFSFYKKDVLVFPHFYSKRFSKKIKFNDRKNKCFISGRVMYLDEIKSPNYLDYIKYFKTNHTHHHRLMIFENQNFLKMELDSYITIQGKAKSESNKTSQNYYKSFNIVDKYNEYKMFMSPGINEFETAIGIMEGMACGAALISKRNKALDDLGFVENVHYISFNGTKEHLKNKINYFQNNNEQLYQIAQEGHNFIKKNFNPDIVIQNLILKLINITN